MKAFASILCPLTCNYFFPCLQSQYNWRVISSLCDCIPLWNEEGRMEMNEIQLWLIFFFFFDGTCQGLHGRWITHRAGENVSQGFSSAFTKLLFCSENSKLNKGLMLLSHARIFWRRATLELPVLVYKYMYIQHPTVYIQYTAYTSIWKTYKAI